MKAIIFESFGDSSQLKLSTMATPQPAENEVLIAIEYTSVNVVDIKIRKGLLTKRIPAVFPVIPGWDAAGVIKAVGKNVTQLKVGDEVYAYCRKSVIQWGTYAEYVVFDAVNVTLKPKKLTFSQAAAIPLVSLTAWQALFNAAHLRSGETILIHAGAGGVGGMAIQFAKNCGAKVITTCRESHFDYVKSHGADEAIDYSKEDFVEKIKAKHFQGLDVVFDTVGGETMQKSIPLLKAGGRLVSLIEHMDEAEAKKHSIQFTYVFVVPSGPDLKQIGELIDAGKVVAPKIEEFPLERAAEAQDKLASGHVEGKLVLKIN